MHFSAMFKNIVTAREFSKAKGACKQLPGPQKELSKTFMSNSNVPVNVLLFTCSVGTFRAFARSSMFQKMFPRTCQTIGEAIVRMKTYRKSHLRSKPLSSRHFLSWQKYGPSRREQAICLSEGISASSDPQSLVVTES